MARTSIDKITKIKPQFIKQIYKNSNKYNGVVFVDRDGTLIREINYLQSKDQIQILPTVVEGIKLLNTKKIAIIVITNQPVVARGLISINKLRKINNDLVRMLISEGAFIDSIYSCPHHPEKNHKDIPKSALRYRINCNCRKPKLGMFYDAISFYHSKKILGVIGDQTRDIKSGKKLSIPTAIVSTGFQGKDKIYNSIPDYKCDSFLDAVKNLF